MSCLRQKTTARGVERIWQCYSQTRWTWNRAHTVQQTKLRGSIRTSSQPSCLALCSGFRSHDDRYYSTSLWAYRERGCMRVHWLVRRLGTFNVDCLTWSTCSIGIHSFIHSIIRFDSSNKVHIKEKDRKDRIIVNLSAIYRHNKAAGRHAATLVFAVRRCLIAIAGRCHYSALLMPFTFTERVTWIHAL